MEALLNDFGLAGFWPIWLVALPLVAAGLLLRVRGRARGARIARAQASARPIREIQAGEVAVTGRWEGAPDGGGLVEEDGHRAVVARTPGASPIADGETVSVVGVAARQVDDPRPGGYRGTGRVWWIDARGPGGHVGAPDVLARAGRRARLFRAAGAALFAAGLALAVGSTVIAWRAAADRDAWAEPSP